MSDRATHSLVPGVRERRSTCFPSLPLWCGCSNPRPGTYCRSEEERKIAPEALVPTSGPLRLCRFKPLRCFSTSPPLCARRNGLSLSQLWGRYVATPNTPLYPANSVLSPHPGGGKGGVRLRSFWPSLPTRESQPTPPSNLFVPKV